MTQTHFISFREVCRRRRCFRLDLSSLSLNGRLPACAFHLLRVEGPDLGTLMRHGRHIAAVRRVSVDDSWHSGHEGHQSRLRGCCRRRRSKRQVNSADPELLEAGPRPGPSTRVGRAWPPRSRSAAGARRVSFLSIFWPPKTDPSGRRVMTGRTARCNPGQQRRLCDVGRGASAPRWRPGSDPRVSRTGGRALTAKTNGLDLIRLSGHDTATALRPDVTARCRAIDGRLDSWHYSLTRQPAHPSAIASFEPSGIHRSVDGRPHCWPIGQLSGGVLGLTTAIDPVAVDALR